MSTVPPGTVMPKQDRLERLADRVLAVAKAIAAQGDGRTFTIDALYSAMSDISRQRLSDAVKTLKDGRRIHAIGRAKGIYELEEAFPARRQISISTLTDGWKLIEIGDRVSEPVTPAEAAELGCYLAGDAVRHSMADKIKSIEMLLADVLHENSTLRLQMEGMRRALAARGEFSFAGATPSPAPEAGGHGEAQHQDKLEETGYATAD